MRGKRLSAEGNSQTFPDVFAEEMAEIARARDKRGIPDNGTQAQDLVGLAFSGGGIRSATFNLGVLQALARHRLLSGIDYLSTVSGGGYIGSWLSSWAYRLDKEYPDPNQVGIIEERLNREPQHLGDITESHEVHFLRKYSNYLTPRLGFLSGDTLAFIGTYVRNLFLNQVILISFLLALLLIPRWLGLLLHAHTGPLSVAVCSLLAILALGLACFGVLSNMKYRYATAPQQGAAAGQSPSPSTSTRNWALSAASVFWYVAVPTFLFCFLLSYALWVLAADAQTRQAFQRSLPSFVVYFGKIFTVGITAAGYSLLWAISAGAASLLSKSQATAGSREAPSGDAKNAHWIAVYWAPLAGLLAGAYLLWAANIFSRWRLDPSQPHSIWFLLTFGVPLTAVAAMAVGSVHLGLIGRRYDDLFREWWARLGGLILAVAACWFLVCVITLFLPLLLRLFWAFLRSSKSKTVGTLIWKTLSALGITTAVAGWATAVLKGLFVAKSSRTGPVPQADAASAAEDRLVRIAPPLFVLGLMALLSWLLSYIVPALSGIGHELDYWTAISHTPWWEVLIFAAVLFAISFFLGTRVDVNEFSLHNAYRNRLVRCYLGATHRHRRPQPFTGFDESDNIYMHQLLGLGAPFHIVNATLNVTKGKELALQARKARSFVFTPLYSGFDYTEDISIANMPGTSAKDAERRDTADVQVKKVGAYRLTQNCSGQSRYPGVRLGTAMAISGAAVSPNMGHYSSGAVSFLLTVFSVRLGWWLGNPLRQKDWESGWPRSSWIALFRELTGSVNEDRSEVYLSDGGHFDNLGVYELVRRRCRLIIACDAGADACCVCSDLAAVIEKCRVDFATEITIKLDDIRPVLQTLPGGQQIRISKKPFSIGEIVYPDKQRGKLIYIKPSLNADLPQDVLDYARLAEAFPHQSTVDQFFDEAQFESYRSLGFACGSSAIKVIRPEMRHLEGKNARWAIFS